MPRKKTITMIEENEHDINAAEALSQTILPAGPVEENEKSERDIQDFFADLGDNESKIKISKYDAASRLKYMGETDPESVSELFIQENWGEGRYKLSLWDKEKHYLGSKNILIGPGIAKRNIEPAPVVNPIPPGVDPVISYQLEALKAEQASNRDIMLKLIDKMGSNGNERSSTMELAEIMAMMKGIIAPPAGVSPMSIISEALPLVRQLIDLGASGGVSKETGFMGIVKDVIGELPNLIKTFAASRTAQAEIAYNPNPQSGVTEMPNVTAPPAQINGIPPQAYALLQQGLRFLKTRAVAGKSPDTFINYVLDTLDDEQSMGIAKLLDLPFEQIAAIDPEINTTVYRPWFEDFFGGLKDALSQRDDTAGASGNGSNITENVVSGKESLPNPAGDKGNGA